MAKVLINDTTLSAIGSAIRFKSNSNETYKPSEMPQAIMDIQSTDLTVSGLAGCAFSFNIWNDLIETGCIHTDNITYAEDMFNNSSTLTNIPFDINFNRDASIIMDGMFLSCSKLTEIPKFNNYPKPASMINMFHWCCSIRNLPEDFVSWFNWINGRVSLGSFMINCFSLRSFPVELCNYSTAYPEFYGTATLDEVVNLPIISSIPNNSTVINVNCSYRLKDLTFVPGGVAEWRGVNLAIYNYVGYGRKTGGTGANSNTNYILDYNSGITADKEVYDDATYQALKNDPDWFTYNAKYSRYNKISAINTINSLPDTPPVTVTNTKPNTITFLGISGELTDGGAINTMTEEEIAVAAAKGWTVAFR